MNTALIVAAGKGTRMGEEVDKLFLEIAGRPVIAHTWQRFDSADCIDEIVLVVRDGRQEEFSQLAAMFRFKKPFRISTFLSTLALTSFGMCPRQNSAAPYLASCSAAGN